ncbi:hypothetical protein SE17_30500 [Kouleothrix aurantiaca]|uniref:Uncharacterized protein n=1 Tax=Kouleothrix aurantiaca TaxID=186479 RepID=A0A0N8PRF9_9CHLR|nr:hypothetical protein SE17_30500 [Kouleothrix aurantiaca]
MAEEQTGSEVVTERVTERTTERPGPSAGSEGTAAPGRFADLEAANAEIARLRAENAGRRVDNRGLQEQIDALKAQVPSTDVREQVAHLQEQLNRYQAASEAGVSRALLAANQELAQATTADEMRAAQEQIARLMAPAAPPTSNPAPPAEPTQPLSREEQTAAAMHTGNMREVERLNAEKLAELSRSG